MFSTFTGIEIGKRSLQAHNQGLLVIGHNLSNMATEGYSRQRIEIGTMEPLSAPQLNRAEVPGQIGQGPLVNRVGRVRDELLEQRIVGQAGDVGYWNTRDRYIKMLEQIHNEPTEVSVRSQMDKFWDAWQELSLHPSELAPREAVVKRGQTLIESIHARYQRLSGTRDMAEQDIAIVTDQVNTFANQLAKLNAEIVKVKAMGDQPNDLMDRRDLLVEKLAALVPVSVDQRDPDEFMVHIDGQVLVQGKIARPLELRTSAENDGYSRLVWADTGDTAQLPGGSLGALFELRDGDIRSEIANLDTLTLTFTDLVNETHRAGSGLNGKSGVDFFTEQPGVNNIAGNYDRDGDGTYDASYIHRVTGGNRLDAEEQLGLAGTITLSGPQGNLEIAYQPTDTVGDLVRRINHSGAEVTARLTREGQLQLRATSSADLANPNFVIRHIEDSGDFLTGYAAVLNASGPEGAYTWERENAVLSLRNDGAEFAVAPLAHPSGWIEVSQAVQRDLTSVAAGFGRNGRPAEAGDGSLALAVARLRNDTVMVGSEGTFDDYFANTVAHIGLAGEQAGLMLETSSRIAKSLQDTRSSISGVNMDEELANMIKFQHGYAAAAKFVQNFDEMLDTIINRMGV